MASIVREAELALLNAPFEADGWSRAIERVARAAHCHSANLVALGGPALIPLNLFTGDRADDAARATADPLLWGDCNWRIRADDRIGLIRHDDHYRAARAPGGTERYDDIVSDLDIAHGCQVSLINDSRNFLGLALFRGERLGAADERCLTVFRHLLRPLQRAVRVQLALDGEAAELMLDGPRAMAGEMMLVDSHGCLAAMSRDAEDLFDTDGLMRLAGSAPEFRDPDDQRRFAGGLARLLASDPVDAPVLDLPVGRRSCCASRRRRATMIRLPVEARRLGFEPHVAVSFRPLTDA